MQRKYCALAYMTLTVGGMYWRHNGVNQLDSPRANLGFCKPFGGLTMELLDLGFGSLGLAYMPLAIGGTY